VGDFANHDEWQIRATQAYMAKRDKDRLEQDTKDKEYLERETNILLPIANRILGTEAYTLWSIELFGRPTPVVANYSHDVFFRAEPRTDSLVALRRCLSCGEYIESFSIVDTLERVGEVLMDEVEWNSHYDCKPVESKPSALQEAIEEIIDRKVGRI